MWEVPQQMMSMGPDTINDGNRDEAQGEGGIFKPW
jgi:hypothetical protein